MSMVWPSSPRQGHCLVPPQGKGFDSMGLLQNDSSHNQEVVSEVIQIRGGHDARLRPLHGSGQHMGGHGVSPQMLALWAVPRSVSTAFAKAISGSNGVSVLHEPFTDCYYFGPNRRSMRYGNRPIVAHFDERAAMELILSAARSDCKTLFIKELAFQALPFVQDELLSRVASTLLVRHPTRVIASLLRLKPDFTEDELGFQALDALDLRITALRGTPPMVIEGEQFRTHPRQTLLHFCSIHGLRFSDEMLNWSMGAMRPWLPHERESQQKWHATLERSQTILPSTDTVSALHLSREQEDMRMRALEIYDRFLRRERLMAGPLDS
ncbi:MAG: hypothetical protein ACKOYH_06570 [Cyanobium sp.]